MLFNMNPLRIVIIYALFSVLWIYFSDHAVEYFVTNTTLFATLSTYKGFFFVFITSVLLYSLIKTKILQIESMQKKLKENEQRLEHVIQGANLGYWDWDYVHHTHIVNDIWLSFLGLKREDIDDIDTDWSNRIHPDDQMIANNAIENTIRNNKPYVIEFRMRHQNGHWVWIEGSGAVVERDKMGAALRLAGTHRDISDRKNAQQEVLFLALNDPLTKLPNRVFLKQELEKRLVNEPALSFIFLDLDRFKTINDMYGHTLGDKVIQLVAERFLSCLSETDFMSRVGGDEFVILTNGHLHVEALCEKLANSLTVPLDVAIEHFKVTTSMGVACCPQDGKSFESLLKNADTAMYEAKKMSSKKCYAFYTSSMTEHLLNVSKLDNDLKEAIDNDELIVCFQPEVNLYTNKITGLEALVRWQHPINGMMMPDSFIARAEETRLIIPLGLLIFKKVLEQLNTWSQQNLFEDVIVAINISSVQIEEDDFVEKIEAIRENVGVSALTIELEVTESCFMSNPKQFAITLQKLENLGYKISIDDFGTGYSSLSYLKQLPLHKLKIDRSFIKDLPEAKDDQAIAKAIIALGKTLELEVLAEGVETQAQKAFLIENGCDSMQGFLFAKPMSAEAWETSLDQN
ncbi:diguanylate cyclase [Sulfurospirillum diekertiae]|uniref:Diguanylate cyclase n=1 Tax=Sulfurospirillum diekertiae TaxID=1854492 RepID=A0A290HEU6_9BACT|nr:bifunctional diguanylate cyclase/phosphodiesterase [Sulfurospirillum diekertiae]ATB69935.1 diguanylate cyclase [Sulfurospirillum diekertiae]